VEPRFEEGNDLQDPLWHLVCTELPSWMGWDNINIATNRGIHLKEMSADHRGVNIDGGDGKIIEMREVAKEHPEG